MPNGYLDANQNFVRLQPGQQAPNGAKTVYAAPQVPTNLPPTWREFTERIQAKNWTGMGWAHEGKAVEDAARQLKAWAQEAMQTDPALGQYLMDVLEDMSYVDNRSEVRKVYLQEGPNPPTNTELGVQKMDDAAQMIEGANEGLTSNAQDQRGRGDRFMDLFEREYGDFMKQDPTSWSVSMPDYYNSSNQQQMERDWSTTNLFRQNANNNPWDANSPFYTNRLGMQRAATQREFDAARDSTLAALAHRGLRGGGVETFARSLNDLERARALSLLAGQSEQERYKSWADWRDNNLTQQYEVDKANKDRVKDVASARTSAANQRASQINTGYATKGSVLNNLLTTGRGLVSDSSSSYGAVNSGAGTLGTVANHQATLGFDQDKVQDAKDNAVGNFFAQTGMKLAEKGVEVAATKAATAGVAYKDTPTQQPQPGDVTTPAARSGSGAAGTPALTDLSMEGSTLQTPSGRAVQGMGAGQQAVGSSMPASQGANARTTQGLASYYAGQRRPGMPMTRRTQAQYNNPYAY